MMIRQATPTDIDQLIDMRCNFITEEFGVQNDDKMAKIRNQLHGYLTANLNRQLLCYLADDNGQIVSTAFLVVMDKPANPKFISGKTGLLLNVYTKPEFRKQGLATNIIKNLIDDARAIGLSYIDLDATKTGKPLYEKLGFYEMINTCTPMRLEL